MNSFNILRQFGRKTPLFSAFNFESGHTINLIQVFIGPTVLECGHIFCNYCIEEWRRQDPRCPICRSVSTLKVKIQMLGDYIENVVQNTFTENAKSGRLAIIEVHS